MLHCFISSFSCNMFLMTLSNRVSIHSELESILFSPHEKGESQNSNFPRKKASKQIEVYGKKQTNKSTRNRGRRIIDRGHFEVIHSRSAGRWPCPPTRISAATAGEDSSGIQRLLPGSEGAGTKWRRYEDLFGCRNLFGSSLCTHPVSSFDSYIERLWFD